MKKSTTSATTPVQPAIRAGRPSRARCGPRHQRRAVVSLALGAGHGISASAVVRMSSPTNKGFFGP